MSGTVEIKQVSTVGSQDEFILRNQLEKILGLRVLDVAWEELREYQSLFKNISIEQAMHLAQVKEALKGKTQAYKAVMERAKGRVPTKSISVSTDYVTFLEQVQAEELKAIQGTSTDIELNIEPTKVSEDWLE